MLTVFRFFSLTRISPELEYVGSGSRWRWSCGVLSGSRGEVKAGRPSWSSSPGRARRGAAEVEAGAAGRTRRGLRAGRGPRTAEAKSGVTRTLLPTKNYIKVSQPSVKPKSSYLTPFYSYTLLFIMLFVALVVAFAFLP